MRARGGLGDLAHATRLTRDRGALRWLDKSGTSSGGDNSGDNEPTPYGYSTHVACTEMVRVLLPPC